MKTDHVIYGVADLHGYLPPIDNDCTLLLIGGDICPNNVDWMSRFRHVNCKFRDWITNLTDRGIKIVCTAGNHDDVLEDLSLIQPFPANFHWALDGLVEVDGISIWGNPWVPQYGNFPFMGSKDLLRRKYEMMPRKFDILLSHGPVYGILDRVQGDRQRAGCKELADAVNKRERAIVLSGHLHLNQGGFQLTRGVAYYNISYLDDANWPTGGPVKINFPPASPD